MKIRKILCIIMLFIYPLILYRILNTPLFSYMTGLDFILHVTTLTFTGTTALLLIFFYEKWT